MSSFKKLSKADITTVPYAANKQWVLPFSCPSISNDYFNVYKGTYITGTFAPNDYTIDPITNVQYERLIYDSINHLFYQSYTDSLDTGSIMFNVDTYTSASQQRPTASYFNYNANPLLIKQFPTGANQTIRVISINQSIYGSKILPNSFQISASGIIIQDDGNGNLYTGSEFVGNVFYAHGLAVITNQSSSYLNLATGSVTRSFSFQNEHIIYENEVRCVARESDFNLTYNPTILKYGGEYITSSSSGYTLTGSLDSTVKDFATGSAFQPYVTTIGLYNDEDELLMVAKLAKPIMLSPDTDTTFIVRYDT